MPPTCPGHDVKLRPHREGRDSLPGLSHQWLQPGTSFIDTGVRRPRPLPDELLDRWPHHDDPALAKFPLPMPDDCDLPAMRTEAARLSHDSDLAGAPTCARWVQRVVQWFHDLGREAGVDHPVIHQRFRAALHRWKQFSKHLPFALAATLLKIIQGGYKVPWAPGVDPSKLRHDCGSNPPMMKTRTRETWAIVAKTLALGAVKPADVTDAKPPVVCPVFFVDETGKLRLVHNLKWLNSSLDESSFPVWLETIQRIRAMFPLDGWATTTDFRSAYFHVPLEEEDKKFLSFALAVDEMPEEAVEMLRRDYPRCERNGRFFFSYQCVNFGFAPSAQTFCLFSQACQHVWARCPSLDQAFAELTSYIDDWGLACQQFKAAIYQILNVLAGMRLLGWLVNIDKTRLLPRRRQVHLSIVVDLEEYTFALSPKRVARILRKLILIRADIRRHNGKVACKTLASFVGSVWSASIVVNDIVSLWCRNMIRELAAQMKIRVSDFSLQRLLRRFWSGCIPWTKGMERELQFWEGYDFARKRSLISRDFVRSKIEAQVKNPDGSLADDVTLLAQDSGELATGMQRMEVDSEGRWATTLGSVIYFSPAEKKYNSTLREILGALRTLQNLLDAKDSRVILPLDSLNTVRAIKWGSRNPEIHAVAIEIFLLCQAKGIELIPVWTERSHYIIEEADKRGRFLEPNDFRTPPCVVTAASSVARRLWGRPLTFDRAASANNAIPGLPFNSLWPQPGHSGVDLFEQNNWHLHINFVHVPFALLPRLLAFLPSTRSRAVVLVPVIHGRSWTPKTLPGAPGFVHRVVYSPADSPLLAHYSSAPTETFRGRYALVFFDFST